MSSLGLSDNAQLQHHMSRRRLLLLMQSGQIGRATEKDRMKKNKKELELPDVTQNVARRRLMQGPERKEKPLLLSLESGTVRRGGGAWVRHGANKQ